MLKPRFAQLRAHIHQSGGETCSVQISDLITFGHGIGRNIGTAFKDFVVVDQNTAKGIGLFDWVNQAGIDKCLLASAFGANGGAHA